MKHKAVIITSMVLLLGMLAAGCGKSSATVFSNSISSITTPLISTSNDTSTLSMNSAASLSANGLSLSLSTNSTTYHVGQEVSIVVDETNTLSTTNDVPTADKYPSSHLEIDFSNRPTIFPFGIAIFRGNYTSSNYSAGIPLVIFDPSEEYQGTLVVGPTSYTFHPSSDTANLENSTYLSSIDYLIKREITLQGYWPSQDYGSKLIQFEPGIYTLIAGDEWGTLVVVHFTVTK